jgi:branched-chain amino acid transport system permease protein
MRSDVLKFKPINVGRWFIWGFTALVFICAPLIFKGGFAVSLLTQMGTFIIFALSYNMLLGQTGMLSFGHAVYSGLGAYCAIHALNMISSGSLPVPVSLLPLIGGLAGAFFGVVFGYVTTKKSGTPFAMITLGIVELVYVCAFMVPFEPFFGGEGGIKANRVVGEPFFGITYGPSIQVYYLVALWCIVCIAAMFAFTQTPLGRMANAVRDNPERVEFLGYNTQRVRWYVLILSSFFAGISGGLSAINFEIVLSEFTKAWQFYLGIFFVMMVLYAPGGVSSLILMNLRVMSFGKFKRLLDPYLGVLVGGLFLTLGVVMVIEMTYHLTLEAANGTARNIFGFQLDTAGATAWMIALSLLIGGILIFEPMRRYFKHTWDKIAEEIEEEQAAKVGL